jgi:hypothetical protein
MVARRSAVVESVPRDVTGSDPADSIRRRVHSPAHWAARIKLMMGSLKPDRRQFKSLFRCGATGRRALSTMLASVGMYDASVGSTDARNRVLDASVSSDRYVLNHITPFFDICSPIVLISKTISAN